MTKDELVEVFRTSNGMEAQVIKSLLDSYDIPCLLKSNAARSVHVFTVDGMGEVRVMCLASMAEEAKEIIGSKTDA